MMSNSGIPFTDKRTLEYEQCLLGAYIMGANITENITKTVFLSEPNRTIFALIQELKVRGLEPDIRLLVSELTNRGKLEAVGGAGYVASLTDTVPSTANVSFYETEVLTAYRGRAVWRAAAMAKESLESRESPETVVTRLGAELETITRSTSNAADSGILFNDLLKKEFPAEDFFVEGLIFPGLTVLTGASKIGKSWAALQLVTALDQGGSFLGTLHTKKRCDVLYCALEDTPKRIQRRIRKQGPVTFNGSRLETKPRSPADLRAFLKANPQFRVVIVDTLQKFLGINDLNDYAQTVSGVSILKEIADSLSIAVIVIHHNRKGADLDGDHIESALGSTGINATADATLTMRRRRGTAEATLSVTGRDVEDMSYTLSWDKDICSWTVTDSGTLRPALSEAQQQIIDLLESEERNWTTAEIAEATGIQKYEVSRQAASLAAKRLIEKPIYGQWRKFASLQSPREMQTLQTSDTAESALETVSAEEPEIW